MTERAKQVAASLPTGTYATDTPTLEYALARTAFLGSLEDGCVMFGIRRSLRDTFADVIEMVIGAVTDAAGRRPAQWTLSRSLAYLQIDRTIFVKVEDYCRTSRDMWLVADRDIYISGYGNEAQIKALRKRLEQIADQDFRVPKIIWHYIASQGHRSTATIQFSEPKPVHERRSSGPDRSNRRPGRGRADRAAARRAATPDGAGPYKPEGARCGAYGDTCAVTGTRIINGGGRAEAQAAHIWAVEDGGPTWCRMGSRSRQPSIGCSTDISSRLPTAVHSLSPTTGFRQIFRCCSADTWR